MIIVDDREFTQHPEIKDLIGIDYVVERLNSADYAFLDCDGVANGVERCSISNLVQKIHSGELEDQLHKMATEYGRIMLLTEGVYGSTNGLLTSYKSSDRGYFRTRVYPHTYYTYVVSVLTRLLDFGIELMHTPNFTHTMDAVRVLYKDRTKAEDERTFFKKIKPVKLPQKISTNPAVPRLMALCPRMSEKLAVRLLLDYGSIWNILNTDEKELLKVKGFGKGMLDNLYTTIGKED